MPGHPFQRGNIKGSKLTGEQVIAIRERYATERGMTQGQLCREYGVSVSTIANIVHGLTWQHLLRGEEAQIVRPPVHLAAPQFSSEDLKAAETRMRERLSEPTSGRGQGMASKALSLYDDKPPTFDEDQAAGQEGLMRLNRELDGPGPIKQQEVEKELDKLVKGD